MNSKNPRNLLSKLSPRQLEVLKLVCKGYLYKEISKELFFSVSAVKAHMAAVYRKLELTHLLIRDERMFQIRSVYCPLLQELEETLPQEQPIQESDPEIEPTPITPEEEEIINGDEKALVTYMQEPVSISGGEEKMKRKKKRTFLKFVLALIMIAFMVFGAWQAWIYISEVPIVSSIIALINPETSAASEPKTSPVAQSEAPSATQPETASVIEPEATSIIEPIVSAIKSSLGSSEDVYEIGEWHKKDDLWIRLREYDLTDYDYDKINLDVEIWNKSDTEIHFSWDTEIHLELKDNLGTRYKLTNRYIPGTDNETLKPQERSDLIPGFSKNTAEYFVSPMFENGVTELLFSVDYLSRFEKVTWRIPVNK